MTPSLLRLTLTLPYQQSLRPESVRSFSPARVLFSRACGGIYLWCVQSLCCRIRQSIITIVCSDEYGRVESLVPLTMFLTIKQLHSMKHSDIDPFLLPPHGPSGREQTLISQGRLPLSGLLNQILAQIFIIILVFAGFPFSSMYGVAPGR